jgi:hypothetical protein
LSLSEYLRKLANRHDPKSLPPLDYMELMRKISEIYVEFHSTGEEMYAKMLLHILQDMRNAIAPGKRGVFDGNNENLAGS